MKKEIRRKIQQAQKEVKLAFEQLEVAEQKYEVAVDKFTKLWVELKKEDPDLVKHWIGNWL